ncbi:MAG: type 4a pilus biogenesis protein PilO [Acidobacteria bacterium]|nr:type 4a pilus biogenesis protein PilO [Acidobacteriota bacterium]
MKLLHRILAEKRHLLVPLAAALGVNLAVYAIAVYPATLKARADEERARQALLARRVAEHSRDEAGATVSGKKRADDELRKFYQEVLPSDLAGARRITYLRLAQMAQQAKLRYERRTVSIERDPDSSLEKVRMSMVLAGNYAEVRQFIYQLETAPEFVVIEDVSLAQGEEGRTALVLTLEIATYYWVGGNGA